MIGEYIRSHAWQLTIAAVAALLGVLGLADEANAAGMILVAGTAHGVAGTGATATFEMEAAMKVLFEDSLEVNVVTESEILDCIEKDTNIQSETTGGGRYVETAHLFGLPAGYGYRTESDPIPVPRGPQIENGRIYLKKSMGSVSITGDVFEKIKQGKEAFTTWSKQQIPLLGKRMASEKDRIMLGYGMGVKARVTVIHAGSSEIEVGHAMGVANFQQAVLQFLANEDLAFGANINGSTLRLNGSGGHNIHLVNVNFRTGRLKLSELPTGLAVGDYIFSADEHGVSSLTSTGQRREFMGLLGHVDDGGIVLDYFNIPRDEFSAWGATVVDISGAPHSGVFNDEAILYGDMQASIYGGAKIDVLIAPYSGALTFWKDLKNDRQLNDPRSWTGGHGKLFVRIRDRIVEVKGARKMPGNIAFGITKGHFKRYTLGKFQWSTRTGSMWQQVIKDGKRYDAFWAYGHDHDEIFCSQPDKNIRWEGLNPAL
jgi:hypothetical protein